jgi:hypothetical protein
VRCIYVGGRPIRAMRALYEFRCTYIQRRRPANLGGLEGVELVGEATELAGEAGQHRRGGPAGCRGVVAEVLGAGGGHRSGRGLPIPHIPERDLHRTRCMSQ